MIFSIERALHSVDSSAKLNGICAPAEVVAVIGDETVQRQIDLPDQDAVVEFIDDAPHLGDDLMHLGLVGGILRQDLFVRRPAVEVMRVGRVVAKVGVLDQVPDHVDAKAVDALAQPEPHHVVDRLAHFGIAPVQIRLLGEKGVVVILPGRFVVLPGAAAEFRQPVVRRAAVRLPDRARCTSRVSGYRASCALSTNQGC